MLREDIAYIEHALTTDMSFSLFPSGITKDWLVKDQYYDGCELVSDDLLFMFFLLVLEAEGVPYA